MGMIHLTVGAAALSLATVALAGGSVNLVSQARSVSGDAFAADAGGPQTEFASASADGFGEWIEAASGAASVTNAESTGGGSQNTTIQSHQISGQGSAFATAETYEFAAEATGSGNALFEVTFEVTEMTPYTIGGEVAEFDSGFVDFSFTGPDGDVITVSPEHNARTSFGQSGMLVPGTYTLEANAYGGTFACCAEFDYAFSNFNFTLDLGFHPADLNQDGDIGPADLALLLDNWGNAGEGDINGDGVVNPADLALLLDNWT